MGKFSIYWGSESPAITAKIKFIIGVIWEKKKNDDITYTHAHTPLMR